MIFQPAMKEKNKKQNFESLGKCTNLFIFLFNL